MALSGLETCRENLENTGLNERSQTNEVVYYMISLTQNIQNR